MAKNLLIVESPAKAKTINLYLGDDFQVLASYGHIRDLPARDGAVDTDRSFAMRYELSEDSKKPVDAIVKAAKKAEAIYLATDLDREGEAISWHLAEVLRERGISPETVPFHRVEFSEITKRAILEAVANPRELSMDLINAQQARRALDYLVGFNVAPILWRKIRPGLGAGRVQSPALRLIVEREREIEAFQPREYWTIEADLEKAGQPFIGRLVSLDGEKLEQFSVTETGTAQDVRNRLLAAAGGQLTVNRVNRKERRRQPAAPFITSTLQLDASRKLGMRPSRAMKIAQQLYEGMPIEGVSQGLITYMRTDSVTLSNDALQDIRARILSQFGKDYLPEAPVQHQNKTRNAQEAHEAIRPTSMDLTPDRVRPFMDTDQARLYEMIWKRTLACQMNPARLDTVAVEFDCAAVGTFRANGQVVVFPGFLAAYEESHAVGQEEKEERLPGLEEGDVVDLREIRADQHFTQPPPRYSEASLVKALEEYGIGRPSTYASIISTLRKREYVEEDSRRLKPTDTGRAVERFLELYFSSYVDYQFTAHLEDELDEVARGEMDWIALLEEFWGPFKEKVEVAMESASRDDSRLTRELGIDPKSGRPLSVRLGRYGPMAQIGTREDEEKPEFAGLRPGQSLETITLEEALELFKLPRALGTTAEGEEVAASIGRFGPYVRYGSKFVSLKGDDDPHTISLERALEVIALKQQADLERILRVFEGTDLQILKGRWGPYLTDGHRNARLAKDREPDSYSLEECQQMIAAAPEPKRRGRGKAGGKKLVVKKAPTQKTEGAKKAKKAKSRKASTRKATSKKPAGKARKTAGDTEQPTES